MTDENMERAKEIDDAVKAADAKKRADAEEAAATGSKLDQILDCLASLGSRMDAYDEQRKAKDEEGESDMEAEIEKDKPRELAADSRKDSRMIQDTWVQEGHQIHFSRRLRLAGLRLFRCAPRGGERNCAESLSSHGRY
jgi:hypothetical protein